jgi:hypothetical protein
MADAGLRSSILALGWRFRPVRSASRLKLLNLFLSLFLIITLSAGCTVGDNDGTGYGSMLEQGAYEIDPVFREFYDQLGGTDVLGQAISPLFMHNNVKYQYTVSGLMTFDPMAPANMRFQLAALGLDMGISEPPVARPDQKDVRYVDGHIVYNDFSSLYERLGGARFVGRPITEVHFNLEKNRFEQYFENLGMYRQELDPVDEVHLLAYGVWKCDASCRQIPLSSDRVIGSLQHTDMRFYDTVARLGPDFTGYALTDAYQTPDGYLEQVFENIVLLIAPEHPGRVFLRPITKVLGIFPDPMQSPSSEEGMNFYPVQGNRGYNIPDIFRNYIALHGGEEVSGPPISEYVRQSDVIYKQCFLNLCLEDHRDEVGNFRVRPTPMGYQYRQFPILPVSLGEDSLAEVQPEEDTPVPTVEAVPQASIENSPTVNSQFDPQVSVQVWENYPLVTPDQAQEIGVSVLENNLPMRMVEPDLILTLPNGQEKTYYMPPTAHDGQTMMVLEPITAPSGTLIPYEVCIFIPGGQKFCVKDSFLIWNNP